MEVELQDRYKSQTYNELKAKKMAFAAKPDAIALTHKPKYLYPQFNFYELEVNRLASLPEYKALAAEITSFNQELDDWKRRNVEIRNLFVTYHLYQNLYSRMKYTSSLIIDRGEAKRAFAEILKWFLEQKPKVRNKAPEKEEGKMKPSTADRETECQIDSLLTTTKTKRELKVYQAMSRTAHSDLFPPKERLLDYKRKEIVQGGLTHQEPRMQRRALSHNTLGKLQKYSGGSFASTMTSFKHAVVTELKREESKIEPVVVPFQVKPPEEKKDEIKGNDGTELKIVRQEDIEDMEREKQVGREELLQQNIVQVLHQEDLPEGQEEILEQQDKVDLKYKKYREDPNAEQYMIAEENIKDTRQSTLRRILKQKEQAIRSKMEELNIANQMMNWGAVKGRTNSQAHMRSERRQLVNKYTQLQFVPKTFEQRQSARKRDIPEYPLLYRSKSSHGSTIEREVERFKINSALKTYGRYINHVEIKPVALQTQDMQEEMRIMRATSLTSFAHQGKRTPFSQTIQAHGAEKHNEDAEDQVQLAKDKLAKKGIAVEKRNLLSALVVTDTMRLEKRDAFPPQAKLFSNPFFPKHLYQTKSKKKKK